MELPTAVIQESPTRGETGAGVTKRTKMRKGGKGKEKETERVASIGTFRRAEACRTCNRGLSWSAASNLIPSDSRRLGDDRLGLEDQGLCCSYQFLQASTTRHQLQRPPKIAIHQSTPQLDANRTRGCGGEKGKEEEAEEERWPYHSPSERRRSEAQEGKVPCTNRHGHAYSSTVHTSTRGR